MRISSTKVVWLLQIPVGLIWAAIYYFSFRFLISKFNILTPGRAEELEDNIEIKPTGKKELRQEAEIILNALGGPENIEDVDACITRLRVSVKDPQKVDNDTLKSLGATDVLQVKGGIQAIYGAKAILYKNHINDILGVE